MIGNEDDGHGRIGNVLGASFSLLRLLFFADPPTAEMLSHFDRKFGPRASNKSGVSATAPRLFELVDRSNPSNSTGWILVDADQGRGDFLKAVLHSPIQLQLSGILNRAVRLEFSETGLRDCLRYCRRNARRIRRPSHGNCTPRRQYARLAIPYAANDMPNFSRCFCGERG